MVIFKIFVLEHQSVEGVGEPETEHDESPCERPPLCLNCKEKHSVDSEECNIWKKEKEIIRRKYMQNISFQEARKQVESNPLQASYANITKISNQQKVIQENNALRSQDLRTPINELKSLIELLKCSISLINQTAIDKTSCPAKTKISLHVQNN